MSPKKRHMNQANYLRVEQTNKAGAIAPAYTIDNP